jgi:hypothetical protein
VKNAKIYSLAVVAVVAAMALIGAGSASATTLCKVSETTCASGNQYASGTSIVGKASNSELIGTFPVKCSESATTLVTGANGNATMVGSVSALSFSGCTLAGSACTVTTLHVPYKAELTGTALSAKSGGTGKPGAHLVCGSIACTFEIEPATGLTVVSGNPANVKAAVTLNRTEGSALLCGSTAEWKATYVAQSPNASVFVTGP